MQAVRHAAMTASLSTPEIDARTNTDWSNRGLMVSSGGSVAAISGRRARTFFTMSSVEATPDL